MINELLATLLNNLVIALKNARSFEEIKQLNADLEAKNIELQASLRKVELLESIKDNLSKFVPVTATRMIEKSPTGVMPESRKRDLSVLFLDEDEKTNARAVRTALAIRGKAQKICDECTSLYRPLDINMGINSRAALVGAVKFDSYTGSPWTYTARGQFINIAARVGAQATKGGIYMTKYTAD